MKAVKQKRVSDYLEKMAVGASLMGIFQDSFWGIPFGIVCFLISYKLTDEPKKED